MGVTRPRNEVQGTMYAGRVVEVGAAITRFGVGDRVFGSVDHGAYADYATVSEDRPVATIPDGIGYDEAASVPYGAITALHFLRELAQVQPGEHVLIIGASGGVGQYAVQIAKYLGAQVTAVCSAQDADRVSELGADHMVDYRSQDYLGSPETYDVIFEISGTKGFWQTRHALKPKGRFLTLLVSFTVLLQMVLTAIFGGKRAFFGVAMGNAAQMEEVARLISSGALQPTVGEVFAFEEIVQAHEAVQSRRSKGTVIVRYMAPNQGPEDGFANGLVPQQTPI